jgi:hypothetical protein
MPVVVGCEGEFGVGTAAKIHLFASLRNAVYAGDFVELYSLKDNIITTKFD